MPHHAADIQGLRLRGRNGRRDTERKAGCDENEALHGGTPV
jgi:hypothetical protein